MHRISKRLFFQLSNKRVVPTQSRIISAKISALRGSRCGVVAYRLDRPALSVSSRLQESPCMAIRHACMMNGANDRGPQIAIGYCFVDRSDSSPA